MRIEIYSDSICPWCFIGKRRLERALAERPQEGLEIIWRTFQLNPTMPPEGMERERYMALKFGAGERSKAVQQPVIEAGKAENIAFAFERMQRTPSTLASHRLLRWAQRQGKGKEMLEALFRAYFEGARDIGQLTILAELAGSVGLDQSAALTYLSGTEDLLDVMAEDARARELGIQGVPTYIFNEKYALSGAHPPEVLHQLFDLVKAEEAKQSSAP